MKLPSRHVLPILFCVVAATASAAEPVAAAAPDAPRKKVALIVADWFHNSHPDVLFTRVFETYSRDGKGIASRLEVASVYRDLPTAKDLSEKYAAQYNFRVVPDVEAALTLGTGKLAVDGVLISTEWAPYPLSDTGQFVYPHRRLFEACAKVFKASGRVVPVFVDKHLADTWGDSKAIYDLAREMNIPLMAGSAVPLSLLVPDASPTRGADLKEIVGISYHTFTTYGFHGVEMVQAIAELRKGGETGIRRVRCITGKGVWEAAGKDYDPQLFALAMEKVQPRTPKGKTHDQVVKDPAVFVIEYADGLRATLFTLNGAAAGWSAAWRTKDGQASGALMYNESTPGTVRFDWQMKGIEDMILTGRPAWPAERTLLTSGTLDAALISKRDGGKPLETPYLGIQYHPAEPWSPPEAMRTPRLVK